MRSVCRGCHSSTVVGPSTAKVAGRCPSSPDLDGSVTSEPRENSEPHVAPSNKRGRTWDRASLGGHSTECRA